MRKSLGSKPTLAQIEAAFPGFRKLWPQIKEACGTTQRAPKSIYFTDVAEPVYGNDYDVARRFLVELTGPKVLSSVHVSCGESAINNGNRSAAVEVPTNHAVITCTFNDHYRCFSMDVQVAKGSLVADLPAGSAL